MASNETCFQGFVRKHTPSFLKAPIAHTCDCILQLSSTYFNYDEFYYEFSSIFEKVNDEYTFQIDAV